MHDIGNLLHLQRHDKLDPSVQKLDLVIDDRLGNASERRVPLSD